MLKLRDLAARSDFEMGPLQVSPSRRLIEGPAGRRHLPPVVMQVLLLLLDRDGQVVTRGDLFDHCWGHAIVGDDSLNRAIASVRGAIAAVAPGRFEVETIPRTGYRLTVVEPCDLQGQPNDAETEAEPRAVARRTVIASAVGIALIGLGGSSIALLPRRHRPPTLARQYYERGIATRGLAYSTNYVQAVGYFRRAVQIDPNYAEAWGALAWSYRVLLATEERPDIARLTALAQSAAHRALELDDGNPDARLALLLLKPHYGRWAEVERGCRRLLGAHPAHSVAQFHLAYVLSETGRPSEAVGYYQRLSEQEPAWPMAKFRLFEQLSAAGRYEEADAKIAEAMLLAPRNAHFWVSKINYLLSTGRRADAFALAADPAEVPIDNDAVVRQEQALLDAYASRTPGARAAALARFVESAQKGDTELTFRAVLGCCILGELDTAYSLLDGYFFGRGPWASKRESRPPTHPLFSVAAAPLRRDRRFQVLLEETGLEAFWRETRTQPDFRRARMA